MLRWLKTVVVSDREKARLDRADRVDALARLLSDALRYHTDHAPDETCPVCGAPDRLDANWPIRAQAEVQQLEQDSGALRAAREREQAARRAMTGLFAATTPATLRAAADAGIDVDAALEAWDTWAAALAAGAPDPAVAALLGAALRAAIGEAQAEQRRRDLDWQPVRVATANWLATARTAIRDKAAVTTLKAAEAWMAVCTAALREERDRDLIVPLNGEPANILHGVPSCRPTPASVFINREGTPPSFSSPSTTPGYISSAHAD